MNPNDVMKNFPKRTAGYLNKLSRNNNREWYAANRDIYNSDFLEPLIYFVEEMGEKLLKLDPEITAIPKIDKSIFRLHRDVRFSKNKEPYKTNAGILFWNGKAKKMESCGFYFHLEPKMLGVGVGMHIIPKHLLKPYRDAVSDLTSGKELNRAVKKVEKNGLYKVSGKIINAFQKDMILILLMLIIFYTMVCLGGMKAKTLRSCTIEIQLIQFIKYLKICCLYINGW